MKINSLICAAILAAVSVNAISTVESGDKVCSQPGQPCDKMKRAAEAVAEAVAESEADARFRHHFCYRRGEACFKAKRDALALAEAVADAHAAANPVPEAGIYPAYISTVS